MVSKSKPLFIEKFLVAFQLKSQDILTKIMQKQWHLHFLDINAFTAVSLLTH